MNWINELPEEAELRRQFQYYYHDPSFPHTISIIVTETLAPQQSVIAVVTDYLDWNRAPYYMSFSHQPKGMSSTIEHAILSCIKSAKELLVVNKPN